MARTIRITETMPRMSLIFTDHACQLTEFFPVVVRFFVPGEQPLRMEDGQLAPPDLKLRKLADDNQCHHEGECRKQVDPLEKCVPDKDRLHEVGHQQNEYPDLPDVPLGLNRLPQRRPGPVVG